MNGGFGAGAEQAGSGGLDLLVNAAGIIGTGATDATALDDFDRMMDVNVRSLVDLTGLCVPLLEISPGEPR